jgi:hypothetical protein
MIAQQLQSLLARLYDVPAEYPINDFLLTDRAARQHAFRCDTDEQVLLSDDGGQLGIGVYIAEQVLQRLAANNPLRDLNDANIADYCTAIEGVSHFHYVSWRAAFSDPVSLLELELQAEVDKYATALQLLTAQQHGRFPYTLHERMFHGVRFHSSLGAEDLARYAQANRYAARYCRKLDQHLRGRRARPDAWLRELRRFYRLGRAEKMRCAEAG